MELSPGFHIGRFAIGAAFFDVISQLREKREDYQQVQVAFDETSPATAPLYVRIVAPPLTLQFDGHTQRLVKLDARDPATFVTFKGQNVSNPEEDALRSIRRTFGPTHDSSRETSSDAHDVLSYPGVSFQICQTTKQLERLTVVPVIDAVSLDEAAATMRLPATVLRDGIEACHIEIDAAGGPANLKITFYDDSRTVHVKLGTTSNEDLLCDLGNPIRSFYREDNRLAIHDQAGTSDEALKPNPYFVSWPHYGLTFLIHGSRHKVIKAVLHSNLPGEVNFARTSRCVWTIANSSGQTASSNEPFSSVRDVVTTSTSRGKSIPASRHLQPTNDTRSSPESFSSSSKGAKTRRAQNSPSPAPAQSIAERPLILDRTVDGTDNLTAQTTEVHAFPGIAFEVTQSDFVETVWLFEGER